MSDDTFPCPSCADEMPRGAKKLMRHLLKNNNEKFKQELLYGTSYTCPDCRRVVADLTNLSITVENNLERSEEE